MPMSNEEKQRVREEEYFRAEVRKQIEASHTAPRSVWQGLADFADTKLGFWLLTTVLAAGVLSGATALQNYLHRNEMEARENAERARADTETVVKLGPLLLSKDPANIRVAYVLLDGLARANGVVPATVAQIKAAVGFVVESGGQGAATIAQLIDQPLSNGSASVQEGAGPATAAPSSQRSVIAASIDTPNLPVRIYIQTGAGDTTGQAALAKAQLAAAGFIMPDIERVADQKLPSRTSVRYCSDKVSQDALADVAKQTQTLIVPAPAIVALDPKLCGRVRYNHFELWFAKT